MPCTYLSILNFLCFFDKRRKATYLQSYTLCNRSMVLPSIGLKHWFYFTLHCQIKNADLIFFTCLGGMRNKQEEVLRGVATCEKKYLSCAMTMRKQEK